MRRTHVSVAPLGSCERQRVCVECVDLMVYHYHHDRYHYDDHLEGQRVCVKCVLERSI